MKAEYDTKIASLEDELASAKKKIEIVEGQARNAWSNTEAKVGDQLFLATSYPLGVGHYSNSFNLYPWR